ncbi:cysteine synthase A [Pendulispora brunnea]|uniref:Cysteine synthase n=1 Tax=Pendulispora brunnea TaxID=2905690 RepID=A0ABZ2KJQ1_9BACT
MALVEARRIDTENGENGGPRFRGAVSEAIGRTPLIELRRLGAGLPGRIAIKLESRNPSGSVKDRVAAALLDDAEQRGLLVPGSTIVAPTSSNTGIAMAHIAAARGYKLRLTIPSDWANERIALLLYLGTDVVVTPGGDMHGARERAKALVQASPGAVLIDQFVSPANPEIHRRTTAQEIWEDSLGQVDAFVAGVGTGGTITGVGLGLRSRKRVELVAVEPKGSPVLSGGVAGKHAIQGIGAGFVPPLLRRDLIDDVITVSDDEAFAHAHRLALEEGILAGVSSGASIAAALALAAQKRMAGKLIVTIVCDSGERYVSTPRAEARPSRGGRR